MKLTKEVEYSVSLKAILDNGGDLRMSLSVAAPYGNRTATAVLNEFPPEVEEMVKKVLAKVLDSEAPKAIDLAEHAAAQARIAAVSLGEEV